MRFWTEKGAAGNIKGTTRSFPYQEYYLQLQVDPDDELPSWPDGVKYAYRYSFREKPNNLPDGFELAWHMRNFLDGLPAEIHDVFHASGWCKLLT